MTRTIRLTRSALAALCAIAPAVAIGCRTDEPPKSTAEAHPAAHPAPVAGPSAPAARPSAPTAAAPAAEAPAVTVAELGKPAPDFTLQDVNGKTVKLSDYKGKRVVLEWFNPTCPYCVQAYSDEGALHTLPEKFMDKGVVWLGINSQGPEENGSSAKDNIAFMEKRGMKAPLLLDPTGHVGKTYGAKSTPHCFVIDEKGVLRYRGALDNTPFGKVKAGEEPVNFVEAALESIEGGKPVAKPETKSYG